MFGGASVRVWACLCVSVCACVRVPERVIYPNLMYLCLGVAGSSGHPQLIPSCMRACVSVCICACECVYACVYVRCVFIWETYWATSPGKCGFGLDRTDKPDK